MHKFSFRTAANGSQDKKSPEELIIQAADKILTTNLVHLSDEEKEKLYIQLEAQCFARVDQYFQNPKEIVDKVLSAATLIKPIIEGSIIKFVVSQMGYEYLEQYVKDHEDWILSPCSSCNNPSCSTLETYDHHIKRQKEKRVDQDKLKNTLLAAFEKITGLKPDLVANEILPEDKSVIN